MERAVISSAAFAPGIAAAAIANPVEAAVNAYPTILNLLSFTKSLNLYSRPCFFSSSLFCLKSLINLPVCLRKDAPATIATPNGGAFEATVNAVAQPADSKSPFPRLNTLFN